MHRRQPPPDNQRPGRPIPGTTAIAGPAPAAATPLQRRQLEEPVAWPGRERLRCLWYRLRLSVAEMNYATRPMVELQAPWITDHHPR
jgi:hypothetical protein